MNKIKIRLFQVHFAHYLMDLCIGIFRLFIFWHLCHCAGQECGFVLRLESPLAGASALKDNCPSLQFCVLNKKLWAVQGVGVRRRQERQSMGVRGCQAGADSDVTAARRFRSPAPERMTSPSVGPGLPRVAQDCGSPGQGRQHLPPTGARDYGHRLMGPSGGPAGSGGWVGE